jgi:hypothetical protein
VSDSVLELCLAGGYFIQMGRIEIAGYSGKHVNVTCGAIIIRVAASARFYSDDHNSSFTLSCA